MLKFNVKLVRLLNRQPPQVLPHLGCKISNDAPGESLRAPDNKWVFCRFRAVGGELGVAEATIRDLISRWRAVQVAPQTQAQPFPPVAVTGSATWASTS